MKETVVALLANDTVAYGTVGSNEDGQEWIIWDIGTRLPSGYYPIVPIEVYDAYRQRISLPLAA